MYNVYIYLYNKQITLQPSTKLDPVSQRGQKPHATSCLYEIGCTCLQAEGLVTTSGYMYCIYTYIYIHLYVCIYVLARRRMKALMWNVIKIGPWRRYEICHTKFKAVLCYVSQKILKLVHQYRQACTVCPLMVFIEDIQYNCWTRHKKMMVMALLQHSNSLKSVKILPNNTTIINYVQYQPN